MPSVPEIEDVRSVLESFELRLRKVLEDAWNEDWLKLIPKKARDMMDATTRANNMFSFVRQRAVAEFLNDPDVRLLVSGRSLKFLFRRKVLVRLKKANRKSGLGSNITTQATLEFINHPQTDLFPETEVYHVDVLYKEDTLATRIEAVIATCRLGFQKVWDYELQKPAAESGGLVISMPPPSNDGGTTPPVVRPREQADKADDADKPRDE
ncbi:MAG: hypothetical protein ACP5P4_13890 [Steroidobacteraceae bacterium]